MTHVEMLLQELELEAQTTRRVLERVPDDRLGWKPHDRSMSLGQLALHVATVPGTIAELSQTSPFPLPEFQQPSAASAASGGISGRANSRSSVVEGPTFKAARDVPVAAMRLNLIAATGIGAPLMRKQPRRVAPRTGSRRRSARRSTARARRPVAGRRRAAHDGGTSDSA